MKTNILLGILIVVLLINGLAMFWWQKASHEHHGHRPPPKISDAIHFTGEKKKEIDELEKLHFKKKEELFEKQKDLRKKLFISENTGIKRDSILSAIGQNQIAIESITVDFFVKIRDVANESQKKELNQLIEKFIHAPPIHRKRR